MVDESLKRGNDFVLTDFGSSEADVEVKLAVRWFEFEDEPTRASWAFLVGVLHLADVVACQSRLLDLSNHPSHRLGGWLSGDLQKCRARNDACLMAKFPELGRDVIQRQSLRDRRA